MNIEQEYLYATDCQISTLNQMVRRKRTPQYDIARQREICRKMLQVCQETDPLVVSSRGYIGGLFWDRVTNLLISAKSEPEGLTGALNRYMEMGK